MRNNHDYEFNYSLTFRQSVSLIVSSIANYFVQMSSVCFTAGQVYSKCLATSTSNKRHASFSAAVSVYETEHTCYSGSDPETDSTVPSPSFSLGSGNLDIPGSLPSSATFSPDSLLSTSSGCTIFSTLDSIDLGSNNSIVIQNSCDTSDTAFTGSLNPFVTYDRFEMRNYRFQHDIHRISFKGITKFKPFTIPEDIKLYIDVKVQKFPSKRFPLATRTELKENEADFDAFMLDLSSNLIPLLEGSNICQSPDIDLMNSGEGFVFVESNGSNHSFKCEHHHSFSAPKSDVHKYNEHFSSVQLQLQNVNGYGENPAIPVFEGINNGSTDKNTVAYVQLCLCITRMRSALRGLTEHISELSADIKRLQADSSGKDTKEETRQKLIKKHQFQLEIVLNQRKKLTCLCLKAITASNFFGNFSDSRNASLSVLHFFVDFLIFGSPEVIYSVSTLNDESCACGNCVSSERSSADSPRNVNSAGIPSVNIQLLKLVYDFYILRLHQTRRAHYQSLNLNSFHSNNSHNPLPNNSYDESTYRYIVLLRSILDNISILLCLYMPAGKSDLNALLNFIENIWSQPHLSKSAKNTSVHMLFISISLIHWGLLADETKDNVKTRKDMNLTKGDKLSLACEEKFVKICAQALQYRVADVRLHVRRNYWLVRTVHPDLHEKIQARIRVNNHIQYPSSSRAYKKHGGHGFDSYSGFNNNFSTFSLKNQNYSSIVKSENIGPFRHMV